MVKGNKYDILKNGSCWIKADFHLHTMSDGEFEYSNDGTHPPENTFVNDYVSKLKEQNINIGVVTNHNKFNVDEFGAIKKKAQKEEILMLPGVELSVNDGSNGIHTLIVFSEEWLKDGHDYITPFITTMFPGKSSPEFQNANGRSDKNILDVVHELDKTDRDYFLVFAHVEQSNGLWKEMSGGKLGDFTNKRYAQVRKRTLGFQKVRTNVKREKVKSWLKDWYPAEVEGSDCKKISEIGSKSGETWLKVGDFTFEAVKYALKDNVNRLRTTKPDRYKHSFIKSINFQGGILNGETINFSPELNTLIGIRGSGKSSILEAIRYVLDIPFGDNATDIKYKNKLVEHTFGSGGTATITAVDIYGQEYQIRRILNDYPESLVNNQLQPGISIRETIVRNPIYFGQKDLSSSGEGFEKDLVEKLIGDNLLEIRNKIEEQKATVNSAITNYLSLNNLDEQIEEYTSKRQNDEFNLERFKKHGVSEKFKKQSKYEQDERVLSQIIKDTHNYIEDLDRFINEHEDTIKNNGKYQSKENPDFFESFYKELEKVSVIFDSQKKEKEQLGRIYKSMGAKSLEFLQFKKTFTDEFAATRRKIEEELKEKGIDTLDLEEFPKLTNKIEQSKNMLEALQKQKDKKNLVRDELFASFNILNNLWESEFKIIKELLDKINSKNSSLLIESEYKGDKKNFLSFMKYSFQGSKIRINTLTNLIHKYEDFVDMYTHFREVLSKCGSSPETFEEYFNDNLQALLTYQVPNKFKIKYRGKELQHHSLGQRASALMLFVLNQQENDLIIVDQPEDDLDNQTIYEDVIKLIKELKPNTQFIFATHNANFPVLGDSEQIHSCCYSDDIVEIETGSIDSSIIQKEIVDIMEGGEDAFNKRKEIYDIWKPQSL